MSTVRVLQVFGCLDRGGAENMIMSVYRNIDREKFQFDFVVHLNRKGDFDDEVKALGGKIYYAPKYNGKNHFEYKKWWDSFFKEHKEYKILHSHVRSTASIYTKIAKKYNIKTVVHSHSTTTYGKGISAKMKDFLQRDITKNADVCLACSVAAGEWLFKGQKYLLYPNTIDAKKFAYSEEKRKAVRSSLNIGDGLVLGHVGRFLALKNHTFLMDVFAKVLKEKPDSFLIMVGEKIGSEGIEKQELVNYAEKKGILNNCIFAGNVSNVNEYLSAFDAFVFPSIIEGLPVTLIEAQAADLPCFVSDSVSHESKITENISFLSLEKGASFWAKEILSAQRRQRADNYKEIYDAGYDIKSGVDKLIQIYSNLL